MKYPLINSYEVIYSIVKSIPQGRVCTYGIIAQLVGEKFSARVVGYALKNVRPEDQIPAHRVVNRNGLLTGRIHFDPPEKMESLLNDEGIKVLDNKVVDFKTVLWNPLVDENFL